VAPDYYRQDRKGNMKTKKIDIFKLYKYEVPATITDPLGNSCEVLITKQTSEQTAKAQDYLSQLIETHVSSIKASQGEAIRKTYQSLLKEDIVKAILRLEEPDVKDILDLAPTESETEALQKWRDARTEKLMIEKDEIVIDYIVNMSVEYKAKITAYRDYIRYLMAQICVDPVTRKLIFSNDPNEINYIGNVSQEVIDALSDKRREILAAETKGDIRRIAKNGNFT